MTNFSPSYYAAMCSIEQDAINRGAIIKPGQWGQTVLQFADHYEIGSGLIWASNVGTWQPLPTHTGSTPTKPGVVNGQVSYSLDGRTKFVWSESESCWLEI